MAYNGSIELISGIKQANNGTFPLVDASAVRIDDNTRLSDVDLSPIDDTAGYNRNKTWSAYKLSADFVGKANRVDPVFTNSISMGRKSGETVGSQSVAVGENCTASGLDTIAGGYYTTASGDYSRSDGTHTIATGRNSHAFGRYNVADIVDYPEWESGNSYAVGDKVKKTSSGFVIYYECIEANSDTEFTGSKWQYIDPPEGNIEVVGNGSGANNRSNARTLDWNGNEYLKGDVYVGCNADSSGGTPLLSTINGMTVEETLLRDELPGTTTTVTLNNDGDPTSIVHSANGTTVRTDAFVWSAGSVTETRTAGDKYITITTNLSTLAQTVSAVTEVE